MTASLNQKLGVGAECVPNLACLRERIAALRDATLAAIADRHQDLAAAHNKYAMFTALLSLYATGHRFCRDPFSDIAAISWQGQFATVSDKVVTPRHANRLLLIPRICLDQFELYSRHLDSLARRLVLRSGRPAEVGHAIYTLLQYRSEPNANPTPRLPFLFLIDPDFQRTRSISPERLAAVYPEWDMPERAHRYLTESDLPALGVQQPLIDFQLGHLPILSHPMGATGSLAVREAGAILLPALEANARNQGWTTLAGLPAQRIAQAPRVAISEKLPEPIHEHPTWGAARRAELREARIKEDAEAVSSVIADQYPLGIPQTFSKEQALALREAVIAASGDAPERIAKRCLLLVGHLKAERRRGKAIFVPGAAAAIFGESSPFSAALAAGYDRAVCCRDAFYRLLSKRADDDTTFHIARRRAEIAVAAALYGALVDPALLSGLAYSVPLDLDELEGTILLPITHARYQYVRHWQPDRLTSRLLIGLAKHPGGLADPVSAAEVATEAMAICSAIGAPAKKRIEVWSHLAKIASPFWQVMLPPHLFSVATGAVPTTSLPPSALARITTGRPLDANQHVTEPDRSEPQAWSPRQNAGNRPHGSYSVFVAQIRAFDRQVAGEEAIGTRKRNRHLRARLADYVRNLVDHRFSFSASVRVLAGWLIHLCERGTLQKRELSVRNTIRPYFSLIAGNLIARLGERSILDLDETQLTQLYGEILAGSEESSRDHLLGRIKEFHHYFFVDWAAPAVNFIELGDTPGANSGPLQADANIVTEREYYATLRLLSNSPSGSARYADQLSGALILGYRFGVRFGEAMRTCVRDLHIDEMSGEHFLDIKPSVHGDPKSDAGRRLVPALGKLCETEIATLLRLIKYAENDSPSDPLAGLFSVEQSPRRAIDAGDAIWHIHNVLRRVTGDHSVRFHHLRHTYANRMYATIMAEAGSLKSPLANLLIEKSVPPDGASWRAYLTCRETRGVDLLRVVEACLGHVSSTTTTSSYLHCMHYVLADFLDRSTAERSLDGLTAYALGARKNTITQMRTRRGDAFDRSILEPLRRSGIFRRDFGCVLGEMDDLPQAPAARVLPDLKAIDVVLRMHSRADGRLDQIAQRIGLPTSIITAMTDAAERLEDQSGFAAYGLVWDPWQAADVATDAPATPLAPRIRKVLSRINASISEIPASTLIKCVDAWTTAVHPQLDRHRWIFTSRAGVFDFLDGLSALDLSPSGLALVIRSSKGAVPELVIRTIINDLREYGVERIYHDDRLPHAGRRHGRNTAFALVPLDEPGTNRVYPRSIDHLLFLIGVLLRIASIPASANQ